MEKIDKNSLTNPRKYPRSIASNINNITIKSVLFKLFIKLNVPLQSYQRIFF